MTALVVIPSPTSEARGADVRLHRLAGEDAPIWLATGFCMLGALFALAVGLTLDPLVAPPSVPPATALVALAPAPPPAALAAPAPAPSPATPVVHAAASDFASVPMPTPADFAEALRGPMSDEEKPTAPSTPPAVVAPSESKTALLGAKPAGGADPGAQAAPAGPEVAPQAPAPPPVAPGVAISASAAAAAPVAPTTAKADVAPSCLPIVAVTFARGSSQPVIDGAEAALEPLRKWLLAHPQAVFSVEGHTDLVGPELYNVMLSYERAQAVVAWLTGLGLPRERLAARAAGASPPPFGAPVAADNRQVVLQIEGVPVCTATDDATGKL